MKYIIRTVVGWGVTLLILALMLANWYVGPGFDNFLWNTWDLIVFSIECTFGISLIIWLPLWYGVG